MSWLVGLFTKTDHHKSYISVGLVTKNNKKKNEIKMISCSNFVSLMVRLTLISLVNILYFLAKAVVRLMYPTGHGITSRFN